MTAFNIIVQPDAAYLISDSAAYDEQGVLRDFCMKGVELTGSILQPCAAIFTGNRMTPGIEAIIEPFASSASLFVSNLSRIGSAAEEMLRSSGVGRPSVSIAVAIYDVPKARAAGYVWSNEGDLFGPRSYYVPRTIQGVRFHVAVDHASLATKLGLEDWHQLDYANPDIFDPERDAVTLLEQQRLEPVEWLGGAHVVGGKGFLTRVTANGVQTRQIAEWPDVIGQRIDPTRLRMGPTNA